MAITNQESPTAILRLAGSLRIITWPGQDWHLFDDIVNILSKTAFNRCSYLDRPFYLLDDHDHTDWDPHLPTRSGELGSHNAWRVLRQPGCCILRSGHRRSHCRLFHLGSANFDSLGTAAPKEEQDRLTVDL